MTIEEVKKYLTSLTSHILFEYKGKSCGIDPLSRTKFNMWFGSNAMAANSINEVMTVKFFDGKSLEEIWNNITNLEF